MGRDEVTEQHEERLRAAARDWLAAEEDLAVAQRDSEEAAVELELAERATLARLLFNQALVELGWTPPARGVRGAG